MGEQIIDARGNAHGMKVNEDGSINYSEYKLEIAKGNVPGVSFEVVTAVNRACGTTYEAISPQGGVYPFPASAVQVSVVSTSVNDDVGNTGAHELFITGLDANYDEITETIEMNGTTPVVTTKSFLRINPGVRIISSGTNKTNVGTITLTNGANILGQIEPLEGFLHQAVFTVPAGYTYFNTNKLFSCGKEDEAELQEFVDIGGTGTFIGFNIFFFFQNILSFTPENYFPIPEKSDVVLRAKKTGLPGDIRISVFYEILKVNNNYL